MILDKALLLKGLAGVAAVGGTVGGGIVYKSLSSSKKEEEGKPKTPPDSDSLEGKVVVSEIIKSTTNELDDLGLSIVCESSKECYITEDNIKKIKFKDLGDSTDQVTVYPNSNLNINLTIKGDGETKRYIFENSGSEVTLTKGSATVKLPAGKTRFIEESKKLKKLDVGNYGLPSRCKSSCSLIDDDLEQIKFSGFDENGKVEVDDFTTNQTITLTIKNNKYIFTNNSSTSISIKNGNTTVDLDQGETDFTVLDNKLKKVDLWDFGLPESCKFTDGSTPKTCTLTPRDLKKIKFKDIGNSPTVSGLSGDQKIDLKIEKIEDSSYPDQRKYIFTNNISETVKITNSTDPNHSITLTKGEDNTFKKENDYLVNVPKKVGPSFDTTELDNKINGLGLPTSCTFAKKASGTNKSIECDLSKDELKNLKFSFGDITSTSGGHGDINSGYGDPETYKIKIEETNEEQFKNKKIRVTFLNRGENSWSSNLTINPTSTDGEKSLIIYKNSDTEFKINSQNKLEKGWKESTFSALVGLKCPKGGEEDSGIYCTLKENTESIKVLINDQPKDFKPSNSTDIENNICFSEGEYNQGIKFEVKNKISGTDKDNSESLSLEKESYEIMRIDGQGWRFTRKVNSH